jgi:hypothetical protein
VRLVQDTAEAREPSDQQSVIVRLVRVGASPQETARIQISPSRPASVRLMPGTYEAIFHNITFVTMSRRIDIAKDDSVIVEAQLRRANYCLGPVITLQH